MTAQVTIITATYNKPAYFAQCAESVLAQTYQDWVWWVVVNAWEFPDGYTEIMSTLYFGDTRRPNHRLWDDPRVHLLWFPVNEPARSQQYVPAHIVNWLYPKVQTPYIYWLSDDDLIDRDGLGVLVEAMGWTTDDPSYQTQAVYGRVEVQNEQPDGSFTTSCWVFDGQDVGLNTPITDLDCRLDASSILHTKALWDRATADGWRMPTDIPSAPHCDGLLLNRLAQFATIHYVPQRINIHRRTRQSTWHKPQL